jgi:flagellar protein FlbD
MIQVTRLNGKVFVLNAEWIRFVEATPDTVITLTQDEKVLVRETVEEVVRRVIAYHREVRLVSRISGETEGGGGHGEGRG